MLVTWRVWLAALATAAGCRDRPTGGEGRPSPLEREIARSLTARFGTAARVACAGAASAPVGCQASLSDGTVLPITVDTTPGEDWRWRVDGVVVETRQVVEHLRGALDELGVRETASCGRAVQVVQPGERVRCALSGGGAAFVTIDADGSTSLELALEPGVAAARSEPASPARDRELTDRSLELERLEGESDGEDEVAGDGGVAIP